MTHKVKLHVGYIGKTRAGDRVEIVDNNGMEMWPWVGSDGEWYADDGSYDIDSHTSLQDIIGPWHDAPDVGEWIGWNGGTCPVHPETVVEVRWPLNKETHKTIGEHMTWQDTCLYRVITPYVEPKKAREWFAVVTDKGAIVAHPDEDMAELYRSGMRRRGNEIIHVREVLDDE